MKRVVQENEGSSGKWEAVAGVWRKTNGVSRNHKETAGVRGKKLKYGQETVGVSVNEQKCGESFQETEGVSRSVYE